MKNGLVVLNIILLLAVGVLFYLQFSSKKVHTTIAETNKSNPTPADTPALNGCKIAYFEMDSVAANFQRAKEMKTELEKKEDKINEQMGSLQNTYQQKFVYLQQHGSTMTSGPIETAKAELTQLEQRIKDTKASLDKE